MRIFKNGKWSDKTKPCVICNTKDDKEVVLIPIYGTNKNGDYTFEAHQVHLECLEGLTYYPDQKIIALSTEL